jgi:hypothetical protein
LGFAGTLLGGSALTESFPASLTQTADPSPPEVVNLIQTSPPPPPMKPDLAQVQVVDEQLMDLDEPVVVKQESRKRSKSLQNGKRKLSQPTFTGKLIPPPPLKSRVPKWKCGQCSMANAMNRAECSNCKREKPMTID